MLRQKILPTGYKTTETWFSELVDANYEYVEAGAAVDSNGNHFIGGTRGTIIKLNSVGRMVWQKKVGSANSIYNITVDSSDNVIVVGECADDTYGGTYEDGLIAKLDNDGVLLWSRGIYGVGDWCRIFGVATGSDDSIAFCGVFIVSNKHCIGKLDSSGNLSWASYLNYADVGANYMFACHVDSSGNVYATGRGNEDYPGNYYSVTVKYNSSGTRQWLKEYGTGIANGFMDGQGVVTDSSGNVYVLVVGAEAGSLYSAGFLLKLNSSGALVSQIKLYNSSASITTEGIATDGAGTIYVGGYDFYAKVSSMSVSYINRFTSSVSFVGKGIAYSGTRLSIAASINSSQNMGVASVYSDGSGKGDYSDFAIATDTVISNATSSLSLMSIGATDTAFTTIRSPSLTVSTASYTSTVSYYEG